MMGVGNLKKPINPAATSPAADDFINGAKVDGKKPMQVASTRERTYKRITFSLSDELDQEIERLSLIPRDFRASRSDVIRAAVALLAMQDEAKIAQLMKDAQQK